MEQAMHDCIEVYLCNVEHERSLRKNRPLFKGAGILLAPLAAQHALACDTDAPTAIEEAAGPKVFILPGVMGSTLSRPRFPIADRVWLDLDDIVLGGVRKLVLREHDGVVYSSGVILSAYPSMRARLRYAGFAARFLPYHWRRSPQETGARLLRSHRAQGVRNVSFVGRCMDGLVARRMAALDPSHEIVAGVIQVGTPNHSAYAPIEVLRATHPSLLKPGKIDIFHTARQIAVDVLRHYPGLLEMMVLPDKRPHDFFDLATWPRGGIQLDGATLQAAGRDRAALAAVDRRFAQIVGVGMMTRQSARIGDDTITYTETLDGDGTMPRDLCEAGDVAKYYVTGVEHGALCNSLAVINAVKDLLTSGRPSLPTVPPAFKAASTQTGERELRERAEAATAAMAPVPGRSVELLEGFVTGHFDAAGDLHRHVDAQTSEPEGVFDAIGGPASPARIAGGIYAAVCRAADTDRGARDERRRGELRQDPAHRAAWRVIDRLIRNISEPEPDNRVAARRAYSNRSRDAAFEGPTENDSFDEFFVLARGAEVGRAVARVRLANGFTGTGFMVGPNLLLTNNHVLPHRHLASTSWATFSYELTHEGLPTTPVHFRLTDEVFLTSPELDFTFVSVEPVSRDGETLSQFGGLALLPRSGKALKREYVNIIQHPGGGYKKVALRENRVLGTDGAFLYYATDTQAGSSGSPCMNEEWQVAALHHMAIRDPNDLSRFVANRGVRISSILKHVRQLSDSGSHDAAAVARAVQQGRGSTPSSCEEDASPQHADYDAPATLPPRRSTVVAQGFDTECEDDAPIEQHQALASWTPEEARAVLSKRGFKELVGHEIGSVAYYQTVLNEAPTWPGGASGVTIGVGYDIGNHTAAEFATDWRHHLPASDYARLRTAVGVRGTAARHKAASMSDIKIALQTASDVFTRTTLPKYVALTYRTLPRDALDALHPHAVSALVSLVFNRGVSFGESGDRYREMRNIKAHMERGSFTAIPAELRSMKRLWDAATLGGLHRRRDDEASLFAAGLLAQKGIVADPCEMVHDEDLLEGHDAVGDVVSANTQPLAPEALGNPYWPRDHRNAPDTWHLPQGTADMPFMCTAEVIERLIAVGSFVPVTAPHGKLIVALRGCALAGGANSVEDADEVRLVPVPPTHTSFRCLVGVADMQTGALSFYLGSTVPWHTYMRRYASGGARCNMLPTGVYKYHVGSHYSRNGGATSYVLRQGDGPGPVQANEGKATVLRTTSDLAYGTGDAWDNTRPHDNIHPAFFPSGFSSAGCLTVRGTQSRDGKHHTATREWSKFRRKAGFDGQNWGVRYDLLLVTGHEASTIANVMRGGGSTEPYNCLRQGSKGPLVRDLQGQLGITRDGDFGAGTCHALASRQIGELKYATGTWSQQMADQLGLVFEHSIPAAE
ncbi:MAG: trypsin-like peptidase domain-containing protein [Pseudomonadota bacterium]